ncbi:MAG: TRAP transporter substrate-binding protein [Spirochaetes bacterium]|nr:MAG: TRAP transporter substrate-binding protein [Spirochaetota bacterium]RKX78669.1 MAG: TRAP transporter substrate-binding protein [Spirochaetota bacterium]RKX89256.1 MAG: TRAP transporter substrate-binding protein [Spirochaetota bacterium]RKX96920.1 MAG: TRAP transporter substrate-binding protein [Spirochaetota bacterium]
MKKTIVVFLLVALLFTGISCTKKEEVTESVETVVLRLAETHGADYPTTQGDYEFARLVEERTDGRIKIEVYPGSQLGEERAVIEQVQFGAIDFTRVSISPLAAFAPDFNALQMPYLYRSPEHMWEVLNSPIGDEFLDSLIPAGFVGLSWFDSGARSFYNSVRPIKTVDDLSGLKIRVQESALMVGLVEALGAVATPMPFGEVYSAIQTGVIDGAENNWPSYYSTSHFEVAGYYTLDEHTRVPEITIASKISMDKLSAEDQKIIKQAAKDSMAFQIKAWADYEKVAEDAVIANGNEIYRLPDNAEFQAAMQPLYDALSDDLQDVVAKVRAVGK